MYIAVKKLSLSCVSVIAMLALSACGGGGGGSSSGSSGGGGVTPTPDTTSPSVSFSPVSLTVASGGTGAFSLSATDNVGVTTGPTVNCTNGGSFSNGTFTAPAVTVLTSSICTAIASDAAGNSDSATLTVTINEPVPDAANPEVTFSPVSLTVISGATGTATLTATDDIGIATGPTVICTNGGSFSGNVFTAPQVNAASIMSICTATASDAVGNSDDATLTVTVNPQVSSFLATTTDTVTTDPVMALIDIPTDPETLVGVTKNAAGTTVSTIAATASGLGIYEDAVVTAQSTLGSVGTAPLKVLYADIDGLEDNLNDLVFIDEVNEELVGVSLNADNSFDVPLSRSVPNICNAGKGSGTRFVGGTGDVDPIRTDFLVGTTNGLFYVPVGFANDEVNTTGFGVPSAIVLNGNYCNLVVSATGAGDTTYAVYDPVTRIISGFEGQNSDAASYEAEFTEDLSGVIDSDFVPLLFDVYTGFFADDIYVMVLDDPNETGSIIAIVDFGTNGETTVFNIDLEAPTDMILFSRSFDNDIILVSPESEYALYIRDSEDADRSIESVNIGLGYDQVSFGAGGAAFASSTTGDIVVRAL